MQEMLLSRPDLMRAVLKRDPELAQGYLYGVTSTKIVCRMGCPSRTPAAQNIVFFSTLQTAAAAGYRPCKRCRPDKEPHALVTEILALVDEDPEADWSEKELIRRGHEPRRVRRAFQSALGTTFLRSLRARRLARAAQTRMSGESMTSAQLDAGFGSASGFRAAIAAKLGRSARELAAPSPLGLGFTDTPLGPMVVAATGDALWLMEFIDRPELPEELAQVERDSGQQLSFEPNEGVGEATEGLERYFAGDLSALASRPVRYGTAFTSCVHDQLVNIPAGTTISYKELAARIGRPSAFRAVARANAANRLAIIVPCHRVIAASGAVSGYAGGKWRKEWLLAHEAKHASQ